MALRVASVSSSRAARVLLLVAALLGYPRERALAQLAANEQPAESLALSRGVVIVPRTGVIYTLARGGKHGIEALDARSLSVRGRSSAAVSPLLVSHGRLLALATDAAPLQLVWLDAERLNVSLECAPVTLPDWVQPSSVDGLGSVFELRAEIIDGVVYVRFAASTGYVGGVPPTPQQRALAERHANGVIRVDARSGATALVPDAPAERTPRAYGMEVPYRTAPFALGPVELSVVMNRSDESAKAFVYRRSYDTGERLPTFAIPAPAGLAILSLDRSAVLSVDAMGSDGAFHRGRLISLSTNKPLGRIELQAQVPETFVIAAARAIFVTQDRLVSAPWNGAHARERTLRTTLYRGPYPPSTPPRPRGPASPL